MIDKMVDLSKNWLYENVYSESQKVQVETLKNIELKNNKKLYMGFLDNNIEYRNIIVSHFLCKNDIKKEFGSYKRSLKKEYRLFYKSIILQQKEQINLLDLLHDKTKNIKQKVYLILSSDILSTDIETVEGVIIYLCQSYELELAIILLMDLINRFGLERIYFVENFIEFCQLNQDDDGSFGVINPFKIGEFFDEEQYIYWKFNLTVHVCLFLMFIQQTTSKGEIYNEAYETDDFTE